MSHIIVLTLVADVLFCAAALAAEPEFHEWESDVGTKLQASFVRVERDGEEGPFVVLKKGDGTEVRVPYLRLSDRSKRLAGRLSIQKRAADLAKEAIRPFVEMVELLIERKAPQTPEDAVSTFLPGLHLGISLAEFEKTVRYTRKQPTQDPAVTVHGALFCGHPVSKAPIFSVLFYFPEKQLARIMVLICPEVLSDLGVRKKVEQCFGPPSRNLQGDEKTDISNALMWPYIIKVACGDGMVWDFPKIHHRVILVNLQKVEDRKADGFPFSETVLLLLLVDDPRISDRLQKKPVEPE